MFFCFLESKSCAGTPSLLELSRGRKLWQCCRGEGGKECSDENYVSDSLIEPTLLTVAEVLDNKGRPKLWERVNDGGGGGNLSNELCGGKLLAGIILLSLLDHRRVGEEKLKAEIRIARVFTL